MGGSLWVYLIDLTFASGRSRLAFFSDLGSPSVFTFTIFQRFGAPRRQNWFQGAEAQFWHPWALLRHTWALLWHPGYHSGGPRIPGISNSTFSMLKTVFSIFPGFALGEFS